VRKALEILCEFGTNPPGLSASALTRRAGMPRSGTHDLLCTLESMDFLRQDPPDKSGVTDKAHGNKIGPPRSPQVPAAAEGIDAAGAILDGLGEA